MMLKDLAIRQMTITARRILTDGATRFLFTQPVAVVIPQVRKSSLYIHIPFCRHLCPYCPYNRIRYDDALIKPFVDALIKEIAYYRERLPGLEVASVYFGGGTPTVLDSYLGRIIDTVQQAFPDHGPLCIETNPGDLTREKVEHLKSWGVDALSLGVQSYQPQFLELLGRAYAPNTIDRVLEWVEAANFPTVNVDMLFALPGQTIEHLAGDLARILAHHVDQVTAYPLFTFPYSSIGAYQKIRQVSMPDLATRKKMYYFLYDYLHQNGFRRVSVWSFQRNCEAPRYSSVTRERYIGFGPGAGSYYESLFTLNTFSVPEYISAIQERGQAIALEMPFTRRLSILYDFYWRIYDTRIPFDRKLQNTRYSIRGDGRLFFLIILGCLLGLVTKKADHFSLTRRGAFWVHWLQNHFSLRYINTIWTAAKETAWPRKIGF